MSEDSYSPVAIPELLAPAGSPAAFYAALAAGADAIYVALGGAFNARRSADSFSEDEFCAACQAAHLAGVRVYVPVNILISEDEMGSALAHVVRAWELGADAFIVQDWGLMHLLRRLYPEFELHVSTQANIHDSRGVAWARELGASRVTLSRELSLPEIEAICASERELGEAGAQIEVFGHGALCFCYSGLCLLSSMRANSEAVRSANRGLCAQPCRLPFDLVDEAGELLSAPGHEKPLCPKDANTIPDLKALAKAGVSSLKIEGRMKAPDYVYATTSVYREALDKLEEAGPSELELWTEQLRRAFNRGFTDAYLHGESGNEMMSYERSNNRGALVGTVSESRSLGTQYLRKDGSRAGRARGKRITPAETTIHLCAHVEKGDLLEIRPESKPQDFLTATVREDAKAGEDIVVRTARPMEAGSVVRCIRAQSLLDSAARVVGRSESGQTVRARAVHAQARVRLGEPFALELSTADGAAFVQIQGAPVEPARTRALNVQDLEEHVGRMGASPFELVSFACELDEGVGMAFSQIHELRAQACEALVEEILRPWSARVVSKPASLRSAMLVAEDELIVQDVDIAQTVVAVKVASPQMAQLARELGVSSVYVNDYELLEQDGWPQNLIPVLSEVYRLPNHNELDRLVQPGKPVLVNNISALAYAQATGAIPELGAALPLHNREALRTMEEAGAKAVWLSPELTLDEMDKLSKTTALSCGVAVYGHERLMTSEHCVLQVANACIEDCASCALRRKKLYLRDEEGALYPTETDCFGRSRIYHANPLDALPEIGKLASAGITRFMVDARFCTEDELARVLDRLRQAQTGKKLRRENAATLGHLYRALV